MGEPYLSMVEGRGTLEGRFSNVQRIDHVGGGGHFSLVFKALDQDSGKEVILKFYRPDKDTAAYAYRWECFEREPIVLSEFVDARDVITLIKGRSEYTELLPTSIPGVSFPIRFAYIALEKADSDMERVLISENWSAEELLVSFRAMVRSVQRIHAKGIAHRDLKPGNFLIVQNAIKLADFGTARHVTANQPGIRSLYSFMPGDKRYCAPEMAAGLHDLDPSFALNGDIFSLGTILFEMFTGVNLGVQLFGPGLLSALLAPLIAVPRDQRLSIFNQSIGTLEQGHPLPSMDSLSTTIPGCIRDKLNELYKGLCHLDYRKRITAYPTVFRAIDTCLIILRNEKRYVTWLRERQARRAIRMNKRIGASK